MELYEVSDSSLPLALLVQRPRHGGLGVADSVETAQIIGCHNLRWVLDWYYYAEGASREAG